MIFGQRKCDFTGLPITPNDRTSVQLYLATLDESGRATGHFEIIDACGAIRSSGQMDALLLEHSRNSAVKKIEVD